MPDIAAIARSWIGTPFIPHARVKRAGVDCVQLAGAIYIEAGILSEFAPAPYTMDGGTHRDTSAVLEWLTASPAFAPTTDAPRCGDLLVFRSGRVEHHVGVMVSSETFVHALRVCNVIESHVQDSTWSRRLTAVYRPKDSPRRARRATEKEEARA